ncbi:GNAT family N-acetyltransferase [Haloprofundus marisrubri]|uniref:GNAT family N-acetyltransferase n=1 Tax=Haloprofundus marisrubri TaxID=1514971 RepID=UPI001969E5F9|nr:GNAT family N-acetyltransferase [Haloprofundus marisrubri]
MKTTAVVRTDLDGYEDELRALLVDYFVEANEQGRAWFDDEEFGASPEEIVAADLERLASATIEKPLFLALHREKRTEEKPAGSIQLKRLDETTAEVKRLYVRPSYRGRGIGRELVESLLAAARADGFETLRLGVAPYHESARSLYGELGFEFTPAYDESHAPAEIRDDWGFMKRSLTE